MRPGHIQVFDGLRITTEHLDHFQGSLHSAIQDIREILGLGRVQCGFEVTVGEGDSCTVQPGIAFDFQKNRIVLDEPQTVQVTFGPEQDAAYVCAKYDQSEKGETEGRATLIFDEAALEVLAVRPTERDNVVPLAKVVRASDGSLQTLPCDELLYPGAALSPPPPVLVIRQGVLRLPPDPASGSCSGAKLAEQWQGGAPVVDLSTADLSLDHLAQSLTCHVALTATVEPVNGSAETRRCSSVGEVTVESQDIAQFAASTIDGKTQLSEHEVACLPLPAPLPDAAQPVYFSVRIASVTDAGAKLVCSLRCADASENLLRAIGQQWARLTWDIQLGWKASGMS